MQKKGGQISGGDEQENPNDRREEELAVAWCKCVIVTHANDLRAEKWYRQTSEVWAKQVFSISKRGKRGSISKCWVNRKQTESLFHMHMHSHTYSQCSMKGGNLRELTRWLELPGNPPIGTFLPVYDLLRTRTGRRAQNWSQIFK